MWDFAWMWAGSIALLLCMVWWDYRGARTGRWGQATLGAGKLSITDHKEDCVDTWLRHAHNACCGTWRPRPDSESAYGMAIVCDRCCARHDGSPINRNAALAENNLGVGLAGETAKGVARYGCDPARSPGSKGAA